MEGDGEDGVRVISSLHLYSQNDEVLRHLLCCSNLYRQAGYCSSV